MIRHKNFMVRVSWIALCFGLLAMPRFSSAESLENRFAKANQLYRDEKHDKAARLYEEIVGATPRLAVYSHPRNALF